MNTKPATNLADQVANHIESLKTRLGQLRAERTQKDAQIEALYSAPITREDALRFCLDYVDARGVEYQRGLGSFDKVFNRVAFPLRSVVPAGGVPGSTQHAPLNLRDVEAGTSFDYSLASNHFSGLLHFVALDNPAVTEFAFYFFFGEQIKAKIREHFDAQFPSYGAQYQDKIGPPIAERYERLTQIAGEVAALDAQIAEVETELGLIRGAAGMTGAKTTAVPAAPLPLNENQQWARDVEIWKALHSVDQSREDMNKLAARMHVSREHVDRIYQMRQPPQKPS